MRDVTCSVFIGFPFGDVVGRGMRRRHGWTCSDGCSRAVSLVPGLGDTESSQRLANRENGVPALCKPGPPLLRVLEYLRQNRSLCRRHEDIVVRGIGRSSAQRPRHLIGIFALLGD
jgi:hypothetical protein